VISEDGAITASDGSDVGAAEVSRSALLRSLKSAPGTCQLPFTASAFTAWQSYVIHGGDESGLDVDAAAGLWEVRRSQSLVPASKQ
jgi:hypothetical protein